MEFDESRVNHLARKLYEADTKTKGLYALKWSELDPSKRSHWRQLSKLAIVDCGNFQTTRTTIPELSVKAKSRDYLELDEIHSALAKALSDLQAAKFKYKTSD